MCSYMLCCVKVLQLIAGLPPMTADPRGESSPSDTTGHYLTLCFGQGHCISYALLSAISFKSQSRHVF